MTTFQSGFARQIGLLPYNQIESIEAAWHVRNGSNGLIKIIEKEEHQAASKTAASEQTNIGIISR